MLTQKLTLIVWQSDSTTMDCCQAHYTCSDVPAKAYLSADASSAKCTWANPLNLPLCRSVCRRTFDTWHC